MSNLSDFIAGGQIQLGADLTFPSTITDYDDGIISVVGIDTTSGLTEVLGLTGKYSIQHLNFTSMSLESAQIKLTVDGVVIWDDTFVLGDPTLLLYGASTNSGAGLDSPFVCQSSLSLEIQMSVDTDINFKYLVRKIL